MTMGVGFLCHDGVVIGSDRQVTGRTFTFPECKLSSLKWKNGHGIFSWAGEHDTSNDFKREIRARFTRDAVISGLDIRQILKECLQASVRKKESFQILFGFWVDGEPHSMLLCNGTDRVVDVKECEVIGYGDSPLTRSLRGAFLEIPVSISVQQARIYAVHFVSQAKKYDGQYVGDGIDVYSIDHSGDSGQRCIRVMDAGQTGAWETEINQMHYWLDILFNRATDKEMPMDAWVEEFMDKLKLFRRWATGE
jgi:hypothetical protein